MAIEERASVCTFDCPDTCSLTVSVEEGRIVLLCWKMGEQSITHWHSPEEGFAGRKPIDERIARGKRTN